LGIENYGGHYFPESPGSPDGEVDTVVAAESEEEEIEELETDPEEPEEFDYHYAADRIYILADEGRVDELVAMIEELEENGYMNPGTYNILNRKALLVRADNLLSQARDLKRQNRHLSHMSGKRYEDTEATINDLLIEAEECHRFITDLTQIIHSEAFSQELNKRTPEDLKP
jgi:hypothetical protein